MVEVLTATQQARVSIEPFTDRLGKPASVDGAPVWASSDVNVLAVEADADGMGATVKAGVAGTAVLTVTADADLGAGVETLTGTLDVEVTPGKAVSLTLSPGPAEEQP